MKDYIPYVSIKPTHATIFSRPTIDSAGSYSKFEHGPNPLLLIQKTEQVTNSNNSGHELSEKAAKRLKTAINWLVLYSKSKKVVSAKSGNSFKFRVNFITLTLPVLQKHLDTNIKKKCLNGFLTEMRDRYSVKNYVWRAECQKNGSIHFHIITDTYINAFALRRSWNRKLELLGYISAYQKKFKQMDFVAYCKATGSKSVVEIQAAKKRFEYGNKTNWWSPNTTDIHSVSKIRNLAAYVSKYMAKSLNHLNQGESRSIQYRRISGRLWNLSQSLSKLKGITDVYTDELRRVIDLAIDSGKFKILREQYYTVVCASISEMLQFSRSWLKKTLSDYARENGYLAGVAPPRGYYLEKSLTF